MTNLKDYCIEDRARQHWIHVYGTRLEIKVNDYIRPIIYIWLNKNIVFECYTCDVGSIEIITGPDPDKFIKVYDYKDGITVYNA